VGRLSGGCVGELSREYGVATIVVVCMGLSGACEWRGKGVAKLGVGSARFRECSITCYI
jgi:hypothetical protein